MDRVVVEIVVVVVVGSGWVWLAVASEAVWVGTRR